MKKLLPILTITMYILLLIAVLLATATFFFMRQPIFGKAPAGTHLEKLNESSHFVDGKFINLSETPDLTKGHSYVSVLWDQLFGDHPNMSPEDAIPSVKTDLFSLDAEENVLVWMGHSSYFIQLNGVRILVDPVFSGSASPIPGTIKAFPGTDRYTSSDIPEVDYLIISHDHYDHLDFKTITNLEQKVKNVICGLGVGSHFRHWGYAEDKIIEQDWNQRYEVKPGFSIHTLPARHFSGRGFERKNTLWASYLIASPTMKIYVGGDSGYDTFFKDIGDEFGPIDLAILDNGQYNDAWKELHLHPAEVLQATRDLKARSLFPVHSSKFVLAMHAWDEPLKEVTRLNVLSDDPISLFTPLIGAKNNLNDTLSVFSLWWEDIP